MAERVTLARTYVEVEEGPPPPEPGGQPKVEPGRFLVLFPNFARFAATTGVWLRKVTTSDAL